MGIRKPYRWGEDSVSIEGRKGVLERTKREGNTPSGDPPGETPGGYGQGDENQGKISVFRSGEGSEIYPRTGASRTASRNVFYHPPTSAPKGPTFGWGTFTH